MSPHARAWLCTAHLGAGELTLIEEGKFHVCASSGRE